ncbi:hypothetical protein KM043_016057 [Ampulex compressa]|nr:hypothetical protein KM043_016057 [Ampulex compressa]
MKYLGVQFIFLVILCIAVAMSKAANVPFKTVNHHKTMAAGLMQYGGASGGVAALVVVLVVALVVVLVVALADLHRDNPAVLPDRNAK